MRDNSWRISESCAPADLSCGHGRDRGLKHLRPVTVVSVRYASLGSNLLANLFTLGIWAKWDLDQKFGPL